MTEEIQEKILFEGLTVLKTLRSVTRVRLLANHQKKLVLFVLLETNNIKIYVLTPNENCLFANRSQLKKGYRILEILQKKKDLKEEAEDQDEIRKLDEELARNGVYYEKGEAHIDGLL
uniref:Flagellar biosynthesis protein FliZ n=1 Tax=Caenorhabditis tropicalis TaxID=1561998 RepID=A0A1I7T3N8_9PELO